jgi:hypothetical protein
MYAGKIISFRRGYLTWVGAILAARGAIAGAGGAVGSP